MWWEKKSGPDPGQRPHPLSAPAARPESWAEPLEPTPRVSDMPNTIQNQTLLGQSMVLHGELTGKEDLLIEGQLDGTISLPDHCVTVGSHGEVKAEIHARQISVLGTVNGNLTAREKIEIRKTGQVVGDLVAAAIAIEDGAYLKGSIDIQREQNQAAARSASLPPAVKASA